ncbi:MAG: 3'-5' exonuclease [Lachnospiraceae bacterium]|nr:3'-5' exonuclease [Lachnospiraceae bacterium]
MIKFNDLNPMQKEAVLNTEGPLLILAGAGSGKTGAICVRIAHLLEIGVKPWNILAITFTNKAAGEMKERVAKMVGKQSEDMWISTFHSFCVKILRRNIGKLGYGNNFTIYDNDDSERIMKECFKRQGLSLADKTFGVSSVLSEIGRQKDNLIDASAYSRNSAGDFRKEKIATLYREYQKTLKENNAFDFNDLIVKTVILLESEPVILLNYQEKFKYIMVDEYQDTNFAQYKLVSILSDKYHNLCVVGDDDQSIYGWRGADIRNILDFEKDFPNTKVIKLEQNYRSTKNIIECANKVIKNNAQRKDKALWTQNEGGNSIKIYKAENELYEAAFIADEIDDCVQNGEEYKDFAVLFRTNAQSRVLEETFIQKNIPYRIFGGVNFYQRKEIKDALAYLKIMVNPNDKLQINRIINLPKRGIGETSIEKMENFAAERGISFYEAMPLAKNIDSLKSKTKNFIDFYELMEKIKKDIISKKPSHAIEEILNRTGYMAMLNEDPTDIGAMRIENIGELLNKAVEYEKSNEEATLTGFLEEVALVADIDAYKENENYVTLMTLHSAKGLEFPYVFMSGMEEGLFPSYMSTIYGSPEKLEEERRLCYVGITRAKKKLYLTWAKSRLMHGQLEYKAPSMFLKEIGFNKTEQKEAPKKEEVKKIYAAKNTFVGRQKPQPNKAMRLNMNILKPKDVALDYSEGDNVRAPKYGIGKVVSITPAGADFEVTVEFEGKGNKKFMAGLSKINKV